MPTITANGIAQNYELTRPREGVAPRGTIVCIHGILLDSLASYYFTLGTALREAGFRVLMYDQRGHGKSTRAATGYRIEDLVEDLAGLLDELGIVDEPVYLLGNSFGGTIAYGFADAHPERVAGIIAVESEPATEEWSAKMGANLHRAASQLGQFEALAWIAARHGPHLARRAKRAKKVLDATSIERDVPASRVFGKEEIAAIQCPVLAVYGSESDLAEQADLMESLMPRCTSTVLAGQEHSVLVDAPRVVLGLLLAWIEEHCLESVRGRGRGTAPETVML